MPSALASWPGWWGYMAVGGVGGSSGINPTLGLSVPQTPPLPTMSFGASIRIAPYSVGLPLLARSPPVLGTA